MQYIWQQPNWTSWQYDINQLATPLANLRHQQGLLLGRMQSLGFALRDEAWLTTLTNDVLKTSEIEGEHFKTDQVRSSLARRLGIDIGALAPVDRHVEGIVEVILNATQHYDQPLTEARLFAWHGALFPTGRSGLSTIRVATWRDDAKGAMQVISGAMGREKIHYEAPPAHRLVDEMHAFLMWFEQQDTLDLVLKAGLAHLWFVTLHPFDDGNGRIARALCDMMLARSEGSAQRFYSLSTQIQLERTDYYQQLERTQKGDADITAWLMWFLGCLQRAIQKANETLSAVIAKADFWQTYGHLALNERQTKLLNKLLDGIDGKMTTAKWAKIAKCSQDTAYRDILTLMDAGVLKKSEAGGRSTGYALAQYR